MTRSKKQIVNYLVKQAYLGGSWYTPKTVFDRFRPNWNEEYYNPFNSTRIQNIGRPFGAKYDQYGQVPEGYSINPEWQKWHDNMPSAPNPDYSTIGVSIAYDNYRRKEPPRYIPNNGVQQSNPYQNPSYSPFMPNNPFTGGPDYGKKWYQIMYDRFKSGLKSLIPSNPFRNPWKGTPMEKEWYKYKFRSLLA